TAQITSADSPTASAPQQTREKPRPEVLHANRVNDIQGYLLRGESVPQALTDGKLGNRALLVAASTLRSGDAAVPQPAAIAIIGDEKAKEDEVTKAHRAAATKTDSQLEFVREQHLGLQQLEATSQMERCGVLSTNCYIRPMGLVRMGLQEGLFNRNPVD